MEKWIILGLSLFAMVQQTKATKRCPVDVVFIVDTSKSISDADFQSEKDFVKQAAREMDIAPGKSRAAIIMFSETASVTVTLGQHPTYEEFQRAVDGLNRQADEVGDWASIVKALNAAKNDVFSEARTSVRRIAVVLSNGKQENDEEDQELGRAAENLRKLGVRVLAVAMGDKPRTEILRTIADREEDLVEASDFHELLSKLPGILSCAACVCTTGNSYIIIDNYETKKNRNDDDIRFDFKSGTNSDEMIMHIEGDYWDYVYIGRLNTLVEYKFDLGSGVKNVIGGWNHSIPTQWEKVQITRNGRIGRVKVSEGYQNTVETDGESPAPSIHLDVPSSKAYFLGSPAEGLHGGLMKLPPNFVGCIRYLSVDSYEPIINAWENKPDSSIEKGSMRPCTASDEIY